MLIEIFIIPISLHCVIMVVKGHNYKAAHSQMKKKKGRQTNTLKHLQNK